MAVPAILDNMPKAPTALVRAIAQLGVEVQRGHWKPDEALLVRLGACLITLYDCLKRPLEVLRLRRRLVRWGVPLVVWNRDAPGYMGKAPWRLKLLERAQLIDIYASHALADGRRFAPLQVLLPNAVDPERYHLDGRTLEQLRDPRGYRWDVSFFGALDGERYKEYRARARFFAALAARLDALGLRYRFIDTLRSPLSEAEQRRLVQQTRINLSYGAGCEYGVSPGHGLPERAFGIPACGGFLLSDRRLHAKDSFTPGLEWVDFEGLEDAVERIRYFLAHFAEARAIAERAHGRVLREHTYRHRAQTLLALVAQWRAAAQKAA